MIMVVSKTEFFANEKYNGGMRPGDDPEMDCAKRIYISDNDECSLIGVEYENGECWIYGARMDQKLADVEEIIHWLEKNI
jgi:hypothetical protein